MTNTAGISFYIFRKDGSKNDAIKKAFLEKMTLTAQDAVEGKLVLADRTEWTLVLESTVQQALKEAHDVACIISFQVREEGNFAVARVRKDSPKTLDSAEQQDHDNQVRKFSPPVRN